MRNRAYRSTRSLVRVSRAMRAMRTGALEAEWIEAPPSPAEVVVIWPWSFPPMPCPRCGELVSHSDAVPVYEVEQGTLREFPRWAHRREVCRENLT